MSKFKGFLDNIANKVTNPKGNLGDWQHSRRLFIDDNLRLAPKQKFLYHVAFQLNGVARSILPDLADKHNLEIGMLVKNAELPKYTANVETRNKYNRKKNVVTSIQYEPIQIVFHDDNFGVTTALLEAYYRYYFADGWYGNDSGAFQKSGFAGDNTYLGQGRNQYRYGLDNNISVPFINNIQISQMARKSFTTYTIVNPIITNWQHDSVDSGDGSTTMVNTITVAYEAVFYNRGPVEAGANGEPAGFGREHYDRIPSPITIAGGGTLGLDGIFGAAIDLYDYITKGKNFNNPFEAAVAGVNLFNATRSLSKEGLREQGYNLLGKVLGAAAGTDVSGVAQTLFPKSGGSGSATNLLVATAAVAGARSFSEGFERGTLQSNPAALEAKKFDLYKSEHQTSGKPGGINDMKEAYDALPDSEKERLENQALGS